MPPSHGGSHRFKSYSAHHNSFGVSCQRGTILGVAWVEERSEVSQSIQIVSIPKVCPEPLEISRFYAQRDELRWARLKHVLDIATYTEADLDALPFGIIHLDENGMILDYNTHEAGLSRMSKTNVLGKNFFAQVAPCTDVPEFYGRFAEGLKSGNLHESFAFEFPFRHGARQVLIQMVGDVQTRTGWIFVADASQVIKLRLDENRTVTLWQISGPPDALNQSDT